MEPVSASLLVAAITALAGGAAGEFGKQSWTSLTGLVKKTFTRTSPVTDAVEDLTADPADPEAAQRLAVLLAEHAGDHPEFAAALREWLTAAPRPESSVTNTVNGTARVHGHLVQGRDFAGPITFGTPTQ